MRKWLRNWFLQRLRKKNAQPVQYRGFTGLQSIAILFEYGPAEAAVRQYAHQLQRQGKEVQMLCYYPRKRKHLPATPAVPCFTASEVNWWGQPKSDAVDALVKTPFGVIISLNQREESPLQFVTAAIRADFRIGLEDSHNPQFDLRLKDAGDWEAILREMDYYLHFINQGR